MTTPAAPFTLAQMLAVMQLSDVEGQLLSFLQAEGLPAITEWAGEPTGLEMTFVDMVSRAVNEGAQSGAPATRQIAAMAAARFLAFARGGWLDLHAYCTYRLLRNPATKTTFTLTITSVATAPAYQFEVGDLWAVGPTGNRYQSTTAGDLEPGGAVEIAFAAEAEGSAYDDDPSRVTLDLATAPAGVALSAAVGDYTAVAQASGSSGFLTPERTDPAVTPDPHSFAIRIDVAGDPGAATFSLQVDAGAFTPRGLLNSENVLGGGTSLRASQGASPSFLAGDVFTFASPGSPNYVQGDDVESDSALAARCRGIWPALSDNVLDGKAILWAMTALPSVNRAAVYPDAVRAGRWIIYLADSHGGIDPAGAQVVEAFAKARLSEGEDMGAVPATNSPVLMTGNARVPAGTTSGRLAEIQAKADVDWAAFLAAQPMGPARVPLAVNLTRILIDAGCEDAGDAIGIAPIDVTLSAGEVPVVAEDLLTSLTWMSS